MVTKASYPEFGKFIFDRRIKLGLSQQNDLALLLKTTQQTISRWEKGISRPKESQIPLIAKLLQVDEEDIYSAAKYKQIANIAISYDQQFPLEALTPDSFEKFCSEFISYKFSGLVVHRIGKTGHAQDGIDIEAILTPRVVYDFQCKREVEFGPGKVKKAVLKNTRTAEKHFILLSRIASPGAREEMKRHAKWYLWDKDDISREIRQSLSKVEQIQLVDTYFPGMRLALIGVTEAGPWQCLDDFYKPYSYKNKLFNHQWELVGREDEFQDLLNGIDDKSKSLLLLIGPGGSGKSKVLKQAVEAFQLKNTGSLIRFLSPTETISNKHLEDLGHKPKLLIVDDAHDRQDLDLLLQYVGKSEGNVKLILTLRPYGKDFITRQASRFAFSTATITEIVLNPLKIEQVEELAKQVLIETNGPVVAAKNIAQLTWDCPLATVIGSQVVSKQLLPLDFASNELDFRNLLLSAFRDVIAGELGTKNESEKIKKILKVLALVQPFYSEDNSVLKIVEEVEGISTTDTSILIRRLSDAGVLFKRGGKLRISPDLLADHIIEESCIGLNGSSTGYAEKVFDADGQKQMEHVLLNLGKLDWRLANGNPSNSSLLEVIWTKIDLKPENAHLQLKALKGIAYYQPDRTLDLIERFIEEGSAEKELPEIIKYTAYNLEHIKRASEDLWLLGSNDPRNLGQTPGHAIRLLSELGAVEPNKPLEFNEAIIDLALTLMNDKSNWQSHYSPMDILAGFIQTEGHTSTYNGREITYKSFVVGYENVAPLRDKVIDATLGLLLSRDVKIGVTAAKFLHNCLRYPMGLFGNQVSKEVRDTWTVEFIKTLNKLKMLIDSNDIDDLVLIQIYSSISWHANYANAETTPIAQGIIDSRPTTLEFSTKLALIDGYRNLFEKFDADLLEQGRQERFDNLSTELLKKYSPEELRHFIDVSLNEIINNCGQESYSPYILYGFLLNTSLELALCTVEDAFKNATSKTRQFVGNSLAKVFDDDPVLGVVWAKRFLESEDELLHAAVGRALASTHNMKIYEGEALNYLIDILNSKHVWVIKNGIDALRNISKFDKTLAMQLIGKMNIGVSNKVADDVCMLFMHDEMIPLKLLPFEEIERITNQLIALPELDGYWIETFLSKISKDYGILAAAFFMVRFNKSVMDHNWNYRPCNFGPYINVKLCFKEADNFNTIISQVVEYLRNYPNKDYFYRHRVGELFQGMFGNYDAEVLKTLENWCDVADESDILTISALLSESQNDFVFENVDFVVNLLSKAKRFSKSCFDESLNYLHNSAIGGLRQGTPGEPFARDLHIRDKSESILQTLPRFSPANRFYEILLKGAKRDIEMSLKEAEALELN